MHVLWLRCELGGHDLGREDFAGDRSGAKSGRFSGYPNMGPGPGLVTQFFSRKILARISEEKIPVRRKTYSSPKFWVVEILYLRVNSNSKVNS